MSYAGKVNAKMLAFFSANGLAKTIILGQELLKANNHKDDTQFRNEVHGEVCESILECAVLDYIKRNDLEDKWFYKKGMILKDIDKPDSKYLTELDFTLFTPFKIFTIECKCYGGGKALVDECKVIRKGVKPYDVYKQHKAHFVTLMKNFNPFRLDTTASQKYAPLQVGLFDFSLGTYNDKREEEWKKKMPLLNIENIDTVLDRYKDKPECWNMEGLRRGADIICKHGEKYREKHLKYVKGLAKKRERKS